MKLRHLLVAASAAAVLVGTSLGASANSWSFSKGESSSDVLSLGIVISNTPVAGTLQGQHNKSVAIGPWSGANASASTTGSAAASIVHTETDTISPYSAPGYAPLAGQQGGSSTTTSVSAAGTTNGGSCAGSGC